MVFAGRYKEALKYYKGSVEKSLYNAGPMQERIMRESLVLAAKCNDRPFLKKLKHQMIAFGLQFESQKEMNRYTDVNNSRSRSKDSVVEDWEVMHWAGNFRRFFTEDCYFDGKEPEPANGNGLGPLMFVEPHFVATKPDLRHPNRTIKVGDSRKKKIPQLIWNIQLNRVENVKSLLEAGASVNVSSESGESPILMAIETMRPDNFGPLRDETCFQLVSSYKHDKKTINRRSSKKRLLPLTSAVFTGKSNVVKKLLDMGASVDSRGETDDQTGLNIAMKLIGILRHPDKHRRKGLASLDLNDPVLLESVRRNGDGLVGLDFRDIRTYLKAQLSDPEMKKYRGHFQNYLVDSTCSHIQYRSLREIIDILLKAGADPNAKHTSPVKGYTPLMLAAEMDEVEIFDLMLKHGGDPSVSFMNRGIKSVDCWGIAEYWKAERVMKALDGLRP